ncbi:MAG: methyltransferase domain-containing protein [Lachnospiraceae bacterium]|nr:methyltransferase domain-containing protein [Lachnospiraceae bacterium]
MTNEELKQFYIDQWSRRKPCNMSHKKEDWDERAFDWEKELHEDEVVIRRNAARVAATVDFLKAHGQLNPEDTVIDIGCGPGRFVAEFAKHAGHVTGLDISPNMCRFGLEYAHSQGVQNVDFIACDFKKTDVIEEDWENKYDLVFSSITPAMSTYESLVKSEIMSRGYCFQSGFVKMVDSPGDEILKEVLTEKEQSGTREMASCQAMFNILCLEGKYPIVDYYTEACREVLDINEKLVRKLLKNSAAPKELFDKKKELILEALRKRANANGQIERFSEVTYGWILWKVQ